MLIRMLITYVFSSVCFCQKASGQKLIVPVADTYTGTTVSLMKFTGQIQKAACPGHWFRGSLGKDMFQSVSTGQFVEVITSENCEQREFEKGELYFIAFRKLTNEEGNETNVLVYFVKGSSGERELRYQSSKAQKIIDCWRMPKSICGGG
jgi:hypothetical protein